MRQLSPNTHEDTMARVMSMALLLCQNFSCAAMFISRNVAIPVSRRQAFCRRMQIRSSTSESGAVVQQEKSAETFLDRLRARQAKDSFLKKAAKDKVKQEKGERAADSIAPTFLQLGIRSEVLEAVKKLNISVPTEVQSLAIPQVLRGKNVVIASHTGSGKTLAYLFPVIQALRKDELDSGVCTMPRKPRAIVLVPTRELAEQVLKVAKSISHIARFRSAMISGGSPMKIQEDALNTPLDLVVGTPGRLLMHIEEGHMAFGNIKYLVLDEADTMFDQGFGPDVRKFLVPLRNRSSQPGDPGFQSILVTATITQAVQKLLDEEFPGIMHIRTSTLHKKIETSRHLFVKVAGNENKLQALLEILEPALEIGKRVMVFCNTVSSCRAVDHFLNEAHLSCVNYHGEVPAEKRVENLNKFKDPGPGPVPALVCTDLAARGLDLVVDHVMMFDFPHNSIDYLHRTGRTARMGAKGRVTSLVTKRDLTLANRIEEAMRRGQTLEGVNAVRERMLHKAQAKFKKDRMAAVARSDSRGVKYQRLGTRALALKKTQGRHFLTSIGQKQKRREERQAAKKSAKA